jgi:plastocyanin
MAHLRPRPSASNPELKSLVTIAKFVYSPAELIAKVGDTITWINRDIVAHTATVCGGLDA